MGIGHLITFDRLNDTLRLLSREDNDVLVKNDVPTVYMTTDISPEGLVAVYEALGADPHGNIVIKLSTGEPGSNYLRPDLIGPLVQSLDTPTIVECSTAYGGSRSSTAMHRLRKITDIRL